MVQSFKTLTRIQIDEALSLYAKVGNLDCYTRLDGNAKGTAAAHAVASVLHWSLVDLAQMTRDSKDFRNAVESIVNIFESENPYKVSESAKFAAAMKDIQESGMTGIPHSDAEMLTIVNKLAELGCVPPELAAQVNAASGNPQVPEHRNPIGFAPSKADPETDARFRKIVRGLESDADKAEEQQ